MLSIHDQTTENVAIAFNLFLLVYKDFRRVNGMKKKIKNVHEILTGMTDKHGRICRYIKHQERKDPKEDWPDGLATALVGYLVYAIMLLEKYKIEIKDSMKKELEESVKQHKG